MKSQKFPQSSNRKKRSICSSFLYHCLAQFRTVWNAVVYKENFYSFIVNVSSKNHAAGFLAAKFCRFEVCNNNDLLADQVFWFVPWSNTGNNLSAAFKAVVQLEFQQFLCTFDWLTFFDLSNTQVNFAKVFDVDEFCNTFILWKLWMSIPVWW